MQPFPITKRNNNIAQAFGITQQRFEELIDEIEQELCESNLEDFYPCDKVNLIRAAVATEAEFAVMCYVILSWEVAENEQIEEEIIWD